MKKIFIILMAAMVAAGSVYAADNKKASNAKSGSKSDKEYTHSVGVVAGSGIGFQYKKMVSAHFTIIEEFGYLGSFAAAGNGGRMSTIGAVDNLVLAYQAQCAEGQGIRLDYFVGGQIKGGYLEGGSGVIGFGAAAAYTVDGGALGGIEYETFNAASARVRINGRSIHPGSAKNKMRNALRIAFELDSLLPEADRPEHTEGYEGFYHLDAMNGTVESAVMDYIIRDHDRQKFEARKAFFASCCDFLNKKYGEDTAVPEINDTYYNLKDALTDHMDLIDRACEAMRSIGVEPVITPVRGGTDGCHLSYAGLPCPNLFTGGHNYHGKYEYIVRESMEKSVELLLALARK